MTEENAARPPQQPQSESPAPAPASTAPSAPASSAPSGPSGPAFGWPQPLWPRRRAWRIASAGWTAWGRPGWSGRPSQARQTQLRPQEEGVPLLRGQSRFHRLQARGDLGHLHSGARKDFAASYDGNLCAAPALADGSHQARPEHRAAAFRRGAIRATFEILEDRGTDHADHFAGRRR